MEGGGEDPFGSLIKFCQPTTSQELKLRSCPFAREDETFPDAFDSLGSSFSPSQSQSQPPGIVMVSLPDSEDNDLPIDENAPAENEEFQTPPEYHHPSSSSSQGDPRRTPISAVDKRADMERITVDDGFRDGELCAETSRLSESVEMEGGGGGNGPLGADCVQRDGQVAVELKKFGAYEVESEEPALKKIRVSEEEGDSMVEGTRIAEKVDDEFINIRLDIVESDEEIGPNEGTSLIDVDSTEDESGDNDDNNEVGKNGGKGSPDGKNNKELEVEKIKFGSSHSYVISNPSEEVIHLDNGERSVLRNGYLSSKESEQELGSNRGDELGGNGKEVLACMNREDIDMFKYNGCGNRDHHWKEVVRRRRELPLSMREKGNDREEKGKIGNLNVKNLSWKELLDTSAILLKNVDHASEDVDFVETAKRRGMTFPQPRWI